MTAVHEQGQPDTYQWRTAPAHLKTRRQLRAAGLSPGGQDVAALMLGKRRGRRLIAHLYDITLARPKRIPSPAQLAAIEKATRTHQARAAERRGYTAADLHTPTDLGPTWSETTTQEEEPVDTNESAAARPQGIGQSRAWLHALVATNQALDRRDRLDAALHQAARAGADIEAQYMARMRRDLDAAEARLAAVREIGNPYSEVAVLAEALYWSPGSDTAAETAEQITARLASEWGVQVDPETWEVSVDPGFDAATAQTATETSAVRTREAAIVDVVSGLALPDHTAAEVAWTVRAWAEATPVSSSSLSERREQLRADLAKVQCTAADRALVEFTVDYLCDHTADMDLLDTPVLVDPGCEVRGRVPQLLERFGEGRIAPAEIAAEISVMTDADQQAVREAGRAIVAGAPVEVQVWPGWVDRDQLADKLRVYAAVVGEHRGDIDERTAQPLTEDERSQVGVGDDVGDRIERLAAIRTELLDTAAEADGLTAAERHHLTAVVRDIDNGTIGSDAPELMWVDERTKADVDGDRCDDVGRRLHITFQQEVIQLLARQDVDVYHHDHEKLLHSVGSISNTIYIVASGSTQGEDRTREAFLTERAELGRDLRKTGVGPDTMTAIREVLDSHAHQAGQLGPAATERRDRWRERIDRIVTTRDDTIAQRQAAIAGHNTTPSRACTTSPALTTGPTHSPHIRHLHNEEIDR